MTRNNPQTIPHVTPGDIVISVMGITGVGKSTFINYFSDVPVPIGDSLEACTGRVDLYPATLPNGMKIYLADTPGFDDTYRKDTDILGEVANWLNQAYDHNIKLAGIIYLHRISDTRVGHATMRNIKMFQALCGDDCLGSVVLATTRWDMIDEETGLRRQTELCDRPQMWKRMIERGSKVFRQDRAQESAFEILDYLINLRRPMNTELQEEMARGATLDQTGAGKEVQAEIDKLKEKYEKKLANLRREMEDAIRRNNLERQEEIDNLKAELELKQQEMLDNERKLQADREELRQQREDEERRQYEALTEQIHQRDVQIVMEQQKLELMRTNNEHEAKIQAMELKLHQAEAEKYKAITAQLEAEARLSNNSDDSCIIL